MTTDQLTSDLAALIGQFVDSNPAAGGKARQDAMSALLAVMGALNAGKFGEGLATAHRPSGKYVVERSDVIGKTVTINGAPISSYGFSRQEELIVWSLYRRQPTISQFAEEVFGDPLTPQNNLRVAITRCNRDLEKLGWALELIGKGQGWRLLVE